MPVPVPPVPTAHSVPHKCIRPGEATSSQSSVLHLLKRALPSSPTRPPPSFGSREQWIDSLPSWRRAKTRHVWGDAFGSAPGLDAHLGFSKGLAGAVDALAIKGAHVQTCIPPRSTLEMSRRNPSSCGQHGGSEHSQDTSSTGHSPVPPASVERDESDMRAWPHAQDLYFEDDGGLFAPILEDDSPEMANGDTGSSPIEPLTPFGDYVDRAIAASDTTLFHDALVPTGSQELRVPISGDCDSQLCQHHLHALAGTKDEAVATVNEPPPSASLIHKQLAEPMAEWIVSYVWKVCTNVLVLPQTIAPYTLPNAPQLHPSIPLHLTAQVHSLLMSTLLQPSAMLLALWYIVRLPVYFGTPGLGTEHVKERRFRAELLGDARDVVNGESLEGIAAFRLIVLGCMLANKWLDDHTFSNKTWHTISNVPVQLLNKLEYFALDIFSYDLSVPSSAWSHWLNHLLSYHHSLAIATYPQPIARPASNPQGLIRKTIQDIMEAPLGHAMDEPVFLGVEQRLREKLGLPASPFEPETLDIDLDEDGPLREEYLPRRRVGNGDSFGTRGSEHDETQNGASTHHCSVAPFQDNSSLPPPARWCPAGDEPLRQFGGRDGSLYPPLQPSFVPRYVGAVPAIYHAWPTVSLPYAPFRHHLEANCTASAPPVPHYTYWAPISCSSVQHPQPVRASDYYASHSHIRGYSIAAFDYRCSDVDLSSDGNGCHPQSTASWTPLHQFGYVASRQSLAPHPPPLNYGSTWLRA